MTRTLSGGTGGWLSRRGLLVALVATVLLAGCGGAGDESAGEERPFNDRNSTVDDLNDSTMETREDPTPASPYGT